MRVFAQHGGTDTLTHVWHVTRLSYLWNRRLHLGADESVLTTGALLHDFYLYDWHVPDRSRRGLHGYTHPRAACVTAVEAFDIGEREQQVILSHMWPLTLRTVPRSREAWIVCLADKACSLKETVCRGKRRSKICG